MTSSAKKGAARAVADLTGGTIIATVEIAAPIERVFRAITSSEEIVRWWGAPDVYTTTEWVSDVRRGGKFRAAGAMPDGQPFGIEGEYLEVEPHHTLVHTWAPDFDGGAVTTVRYRLDSIEGGTKVTLRHEGFQGRPESCSSHALGWEQVLGWLSDFAAPPAKQEFFLCRLLPPRPTFPSDMSEAEARLMSEHVAYWQPRLQDGTVLVFGPVFDPKGAWGVAVIRTESVQRAKELTDGDPVVRAGLGFRYDVLAMPSTLVGTL